MRSLKAILAVAAVTLLVAACGGDKTPPAGNGESSSDASDSDSDSAEADASLPADNYVDQAEPSFSADDTHPPTQWKSRMFASAGS